MGRGPEITTPHVARIRGGRGSCWDNMARSCDVRSDQRLDRSGSWGQCAMVQRTVLVVAARSHVCPSGLNTTTTLVYPVRVPRALAVRVSHSRNRGVVAGVARVYPSGLQRRRPTTPPWCDRSG